MELIEVDILEKYKEFFSKNFIGLECGKGWNGILIDMFENFRKNNIKIKMIQIKEKFGSLRIYIDFPENIEEYELLEKIIHEAENKSWTTCEGCGAENKISKKESWIINFCKKCQMLEKLS